MRKTFKKKKALCFLCSFFAILDLCLVPKESMLSSQHYLFWNFFVFFFCQNLVNLFIVDVCNFQSSKED